MSHALTNLTDLFVRSSTITSLRMSGEIESEWTMIKASIVEVAIKSCGQKVTIACQGDNFRTLWWTSEVKEAVKLNKDASWAWLAGGSAEAADMYQLVSRAATRAVTEGKRRGDGFSAGLKEVWANPQMAPEKEARLSPVSAEYCHWALSL